jgi:GH15 family glucan-1,4-alpha-glucosidase
MGSGAYPPIRDLAAIGDGRTVALIDRAGSVVWMCAPDLDGPSVFGSLLDAGGGGSFTVVPEEPFRASRRYLPGTNVLETEFSTASGVVRVTDALTTPDGGVAPLRELCRRIEPVAGHVPMRWEMRPGFDHGRRPASIGERYGVPVAEAPGVAIAVQSWDAGVPERSGSSIVGRFRAERDALLALSIACDEPLVFPARGDVEHRLDATTRFWREWSSACAYDGPWHDAVVRSALTLKLLVFAPSGAVAAAATTSLPEEIGGERNWDYRASWVRDSAFTLKAFLDLGFDAEAEAYFWWLMHASQLTHPRLGVLYRLDGSMDIEERELPLEGYRGSTPVRVGNAAIAQLQLDIYGALLQTASIAAARAGRLDRDLAHRLARTADLVCDLWREPDSGIWEVRTEPLHFTQSKMMCWIALDRAIALAEDGRIAASTDRWRRERDAIDRFIASRCWSERSRCYARAAGATDTDAAILLGLLLGYGDPRDPRMIATVDAIGRDLARGPYLDRYRADDGLAGREGAFLACSFWYVEALACIGRRSQAEARMNELVATANDVGLFAEEIEPGSGAFLGNFPQALTHLALIGAAVTLGGRA